MRREAAAIALALGFLVGGPVLGAPRIFALVDGEGITYQTLDKDCRDFPDPCPRPNLDVLGIIIPSMYPGAVTKKVSVQKRDIETGAFPGYIDVNSAEPDVVMVHWSSFAAIEGAPCYPKGDESAIECAEQVVEFLANIYRANEANIVIYSRKSGICEPDFNDSLRRLVFRLIERDQRLHNFARDIGFIAMTPDTEMRNFNTAVTQNRIRQLVDALTTDEFPAWSGRRSDGLCILSSLE